MTQVQNHFENIADNLAEKGFCVTNDFLSQQEVLAIRSLPIVLGNISELKKAGIGKETRQINEGIRGDYISWIDPGTAPEAIVLYLERITALRQFLNEALFLGLKDFRCTSHATRPEPATNDTSINFTKTITAVFLSSVT